MTYLKNISSKNGLIKSSNRVLGEIFSAEEENSYPCSLSNKQFSMSKKINKNL